MKIDIIGTCPNFQLFPIGTLVLLGLIPILKLCHMRFQQFLFFNWSFGHGKRPRALYWSEQLPNYIQNDNGYHILLLCLGRGRSSGMLHI
jgi:hypothetical protein